MLQSSLGRQDRYGGTQLSCLGDDDDDDDDVDDDDALTQGAVVFSEQPRDVCGLQVCDARRAPVHQPRVPVLIPILFFGPKLLTWVADPHCDALTCTAVRLVQLLDSIGGSDASAAAAANATDERSQSQPLMMSLELSRAISQRRKRGRMRSKKMEQRRKKRSLEMLLDRWLLPARACAHAFRYYLSSAGCLLIPSSLCKVVWAAF
jgi:hypothetical protein